MVPRQLEHVLELRDDPRVVDVEADPGGRPKVRPLHVGRADVRPLIGHDEFAVTHARVPGVSPVLARHLIPTRQPNLSDLERAPARHAVVIGGSGLRRTSMSLALDVNELRKRAYKFMFVYMHSISPVMVCMDGANI